MKKKNLKSEKLQKLALFGLASSALLSNGMLSAEDVTITLQNINQIQQFSGFSGTQDLRDFSNYFAGHGCGSAASTSENTNANRVQSSCQTMRPSYNQQAPQLSDTYPQSRANSYTTKPNHSSQLQTAQPTSWATTQQPSTNSSHTYISESASQNNSQLPLNQIEQPRQPQNSKQPRTFANRSYISDAAPQDNLNVEQPHNSSKSHQVQRAQENTQTSPTRQKPYMHGAMPQDNLNSELPNDQTRPSKPLQKQMKVDGQAFRTVSYYNSNHSLAEADKISANKNTLSENTLMPHLNIQGKAAFQGMSEEGKKLALTLANQECKGQNDCKGMNSCKTQDHACAGQGGCKGQGNCSFKDKNVAVKIAAQKMAEKRGEALKR